MAAILLASAVTMSSTAIALKQLSDGGELNSQHGRPTLGVRLLQDHRLRVQRCARQSIAGRRLSGQPGTSGRRLAGLATEHTMMGETPTRMFPSSAKNRVLSDGVSIEVPFGPMKRAITTRDASTITRLSKKRCSVNATCPTTCRPLPGRHPAESGFHDTISSSSPRAHCLAK